MTDLGVKFSPWGLKMDVLGRHIWVQERFWRQGPSSGGPKESFLVVFGSFFGDFLDAFLMTFWTSHFLIKNHDFLKMVLSSAREHHFWRSGGDLEGPRNDQNEPKVVSEGCKKAMHKNHKILINNMKKWKTQTLTKCCIYFTKLMFSIFLIK